MFTSRLRDIRYFIAISSLLFSISEAGLSAFPFEKHGLTCVGPLPTWENAFPPPLVRSSFRNLQELCVGTSSPWPPSLNGQCHRSGVPTFPNVDRAFFGLFTNQYTRALRWFCYARCSCTGKPLKFDDNGSLATQVKVNNRLTIDVSNGQVVQVWEDNPSGAEESETETSTQQDAVQGQNAATVEERVTLAPLPTAGPSSPNVHRRPVPFGNEEGLSAPPALQVCGTECSGPLDCTSDQASPSSSVPPCRCVARVKREINDFGSSAAKWLVTMCMVINTKNSGNPSKIGGRSVEIDVNKEWSCACNTSYVSEACCGSSTGLVWESSELKRGVLDLGR